MERGQHLLREEVRDAGKEELLSGNKSTLTGMGEKYHR